MKIEILFSEVCNLYGDPQNITYLRETLPEAEFIETPLDKEPYFVKSKPDMIYIGSMSEKIQRRVIDALKPYKARILELTDEGCVFLATGNSADVFLDKINYVTEKDSIDGLGIFKGTVNCDLFKRVNGKVIGDCDGQTVTGFRSQFTSIDADNMDCAFLKVERGFGINSQSKLEGFRKNNLIVTQLLGPILPLNPDFCKYLIGLAGVDAVPAYYEIAKAAYNQRVSEFRDPNVKY